MSVHSEALAREAKITVGRVLQQVAATSYSMAAPISDNFSSLLSACKHSHSLYSVTVQLVLHMSARLFCWCMPSRLPRSTEHVQSTLLFRPYS